MVHLTKEETSNRLLHLSHADIEELKNLEFPTHLEISLSTICDLKCVYCSPMFSSQWMAEKIKYKEIPLSKVPKDENVEYEEIWWNWFTTTAHKSVNVITFVGGEPLINDKFYLYANKIIDFIVAENKNKAFQIFIATNFNTPAKYFDKLKQLLTRINDLPNLTFNIGVSFESIGPKHEFIRSNASWEIFNNNLTNLMSLMPTLDPGRHKCNIVVMPAINVLSVSDLPNFARYITKIREDHDRIIFLSSTHVTYPMMYSPFILTADFNKYIDEAIEIIGSSVHCIDPNLNGGWPKFVNYLKTLKDSIAHQSDNKNHSRKLLIEDLHTIKIRRGLDFETTFPEMKSFFEFCNNC